MKNLSGLLILCLLLSACTNYPQRSSSAHYSAPVLQLVQRAETALDNNDIVAAEGYLERALRIEPNNAHLWLQLANISCENGNFTDCHNFALKGKRYANETALIKKFNLLIEQVR